MSDALEFLRACLMTPALLSSACALLVVPTLAWIGVRCLVPTLERMNDDPQWQASLSALGAALPALLFVVIGLVTMRQAWDSACLHFATGRFIYGIVVTLTICGIGRAVAHAVRRRAEVNALLQRSTEPDARLCAAAAICGVRAREIDEPDAFMGLAGLGRPVVLVSKRALERLNDDELQAALRHEHAHAQRGDLIVAALVTFFVDLLPFRSDALVALHFRAREFAADAHAARHAQPHDIAAALLAIVRVDRCTSPIAAFAETTNVIARMNVLLAAEPLRPSRTRRILAASSLIVMFVAGALPVVAAVVLGYTCAMGKM